MRVYLSYNLYDIQHKCLLLQSRGIAVKTCQPSSIMASKLDSEAMSGTCWIYMIRALSCRWDTPMAGGTIKAQLLIQTNLYPILPVLLRDRPLMYKVSITALGAKCAMCYEKTTQSRCMSHTAYLRHLVYSICGSQSASWTFSIFRRKLGNDKQTKQGLDCDKWGIHLTKI